MVEKAASVQRNILKDLQKAGELFLKATLKNTLRKSDCLESKQRSDGGSRLLCSTVLIHIEQRLPLLRSEGSS